jgi:hypothetical protein
MDYYNTYRNANYAGNKVTFKYTITRVWPQTNFVHIKFPTGIFAEFKAGNCW